MPSIRNLFKKSTSPIEKQTKPEKPESLTEKQIKKCKINFASKKLATLFNKKGVTETEIQGTPNICYVKSRNAKGIIVYTSIDNVDSITKKAWKCMKIDACERWISRCGTDFKKLEKGAQNSILSAAKSGSIANWDDFYKKSFCKEKTKIQVGPTQYIEWDSAITVEKFFSLIGNSYQADKYMKQIRLSENELKDKKIEVYDWSALFDYGQ